MLILSQKISFSQKINCFADFEGGNVNIITINNEKQSIEFTSTLKESDTRNIWFYFGITGYKTNEKLTLNLKTKNNYSPLHLVYSYDNQNWKRQKQTVTDSFYQYVLIPAKDTLFVSTGYPYVYSSVQNLLKRISSNESVVVSYLTTSEKGRPVPLISITNRNLPSNPKEVLWFVARQHAFEVPGSYFAEGLIEYFISDDKIARTLRDSFLIYIAPMVDVDMVAIGGTGKDQSPVDFNRDWRPPSTLNAVKALQERINTTTTDNNLRLFMDIHSPYPNDKRTSFYFNEYKEDTEKYQNIEHFFDLFEKYDGERQISVKNYSVNAHQLNARRYIDSKNCIETSTPCFYKIAFSTTYEQSWNSKNNGTVYTVKEIKKSAENFAKTIYDYFIVEER